MTTVHKSYDISSFKARPDEGEGTFEAVVSVFGNVDLQGDRVMPGAFEKSVQKWMDSGDKLPVLWSHDWADPFAHIGWVDPKDMREVRGKAGQVPGGLLVKGHLDVHKPFAKQVYDLLSERRVKEWSFSYDIPAGGEKRGKDGANELSTVDIIELGPTLKGANPSTVTLGTKSANEDAERERRVKLRLDRAATAELMLGFKWDGGAAMQKCHSAADYRKIAFERANDSDPDTAAHWALPHHPSPGADADPAGVSAALAALHGGRGGAPDLKNKAAAESHLSAHSSSSKADWTPSAHPRDSEGRFTDSGGGGGGYREELTGRSTEDLQTIANAPGALPDVRRIATELVSERGGSEGSSSVYRANVKPGALVSWRHPNGTTRESGIVVGASGSELTVDITDNAGTYRFVGKPEDFPGLKVEMTADEMRGDKSLGKPWHVEKRGEEWCVIKDADDSEVACHPTQEAANAQVRALYASEKAQQKAGRVVGAKAAAALKDALTSAVDAWASKMNGDGDSAPQEKAKELAGRIMLNLSDLVEEVLEPGDKKDFARGYADGSAGRAKSEELTAEYVRGFDDGVTDRATMADKEIEKFNAIIESLK